MYDTLSDVRQDKSYTQVCLENEYVKVCVLPELGGRIFEAGDKTNGNFFYKQSVIKPALIGMLGAWISGGVGGTSRTITARRASCPSSYRTQEFPDGSKTIWMGEAELRDRMRWAVGLTLRPGSSVLEAQVTALNTTPLQYSLLYFANVAVHTNDNYQVIFPPSTQFATQHAKREFARWPVADSVYNGIDFHQGRRRQHVEEPSELDLDVRREREGRLALRLRPRQAGWNAARGGSPPGARQEVLHVGHRPRRPLVGQDSQRHRWPLSGVDGGCVERQPARLQLAAAP
ncbi:MAG: DUF5107 domain-containing protein [Bryobacterales bacterium]|nr:DUF5107 domain-containing protein [Bryobacterales bacterium]